MAWLVSFCKHGRQVLKINNVLSEVLELCFGTAQGGVLAPMMFLIYINDLLDIDVDSFLFAYADDTALVSSVSSRASLRARVDGDLAKVSDRVKSGTDC